MQKIVNVLALVSFVGIVGVVGAGGYVFLQKDAIIKDVTEGNPAKNTKLVFSTGNKIDSSFVSGFVLDPLKNKFVEGALVVLYNNCLLYTSDAADE